MVRYVETAVFLGLAVGLHLVLFAGVPPRGTEAGGAGGEETITILAASDRVETMVEAWKRPPEIEIENVEKQLAPTPDVAPPRPMEMTALPPQPDQPIPLQHPGAEQMPMLMALPQRIETRDVTLPMPVPQKMKPVEKPKEKESRKPPVRLTAPTPPKQDEAPPEIAPPAPPEPAPEALPQDPSLAGKRPVSRPERPKKRKELAKEPSKTAKKAAKAQSAARGTAGQRAAGTGGGAVAGSGKAKVTSGATKAKVAALQQVWGAKIRNRVERAKRHPGGRKAGRVTVALNVTRGGKLAGVSVRKSSGNASLDKAAVSAVRRAGRFPKAPDGLTKAAYTFTITMAFN
ncbi:TonB family protein [Aquicoccus sp. SU-CL01552]|uniref:energy transducer TonB family protein n=1 Tax=Aquicoccus sp. SU-CL01552 TaxID=3127656 RepID=UPI003103366E